MNGLATIGRGNLASDAFGCAFVWGFIDAIGRAGGAPSALSAPPSDPPPPAA